MSRMRVWPVVAALGCLGLLVGTVDAATRTSPVGSTRPLPSPGPLDYSRDTGGRLQRLSSRFISDNLGFSAPRPPSDGSLPAASAAAAQQSGPAVTSPVYHCVNGHQTEDPLSPPCVASFQGDNGGATWRGVSRDEVRLLVYLYPVVGPVPCELASPTCGGTPQYGTYTDVEAPPTAGEDPQVTALRLLQEYFNRRYQTFGRRVHLIAYFTGPATSSTPTERFVEEADENRAFAQPFAVVRRERTAYAGLPRPSAADAYQEELARHQIVSFEFNGMRTRDLADRYPGLVWSYRPGLEQLADLYASYVCQKVVNKPAVLSGNPGDNGRPRKLALLHAEGPGQEPSEYLAARLRALIAGCGGHLDADLSYAPGAVPCDSAFFNPSPGSADASPSYLTQVIALRALGITTVLSPGCLISRYALAAHLTAWLPEWIVLGDGGVETNLQGGTTALVTLDHRGIVITPGSVTPEIGGTVCAAAMREVDPLGHNTAVYPSGCPFYQLLRQAFSAIQLAGPLLTPSSIVAGEASADFPGPSTPQAPRCRFAPGDYTCLKDAQVELWSVSHVEPAGNVPGLTPFFLKPTSGRSLFGCWSTVDGGRRYLPWQWPAGNIDAQLSANQPCNDPGQIGD